MVTEPVKKLTVLYRNRRFIATFQLDLILSYTNPVQTHVSYFFQMIRFDSILK